MRTLIDGKMEPDFHRVLWDGRDDTGNQIGSGVYLSRLETDSQTLTRKLVMMK